ncbi:murein biosynthesis integral membrane protein MurJ [Rhizobium johnstonii]|uniref:Probable lipid II flippase MurJ n=2 Tax=Rhizobium TaxID=379 RepID=Q1MMA7_RHIJ3|nr:MULTISPECIES: murein biosynthesis integral membrane protein MurJ [Rhizobium]MBB4506227.1 putative peptidoglycan lipid II flippase [Rhizobium leguminosarum]MBY5320539.1 murein biosynthesis integral membrane protein MurJ [Rhizobium leguminosarum]MBY5376975.1 murein biosynthesis integral membrane protein MurJ [Rhizobium leguminosarum]MBY5379791.1 murein biosynthesis integral membrane protein MurJ [Rhizobium leguminosarum]MBY5388805.1 murein biosynthesis integral membrane protein MurJ [Rhizobiu
MSLVKKFATVGGATLGSRIFGFARETLMAAALGTGPMADVFYAAFRFPNLFRRLFAEGAFNAAFVPLFAKEIEANGTDGAKRFSEEVFGVLFSVLLLITIVMELAMPLLVRFVIAPGFADDPEKFSITIRMAAVMFPYLMCMSLTAMMSGMLNSLHHFFAAAIAPVFLNVVMIGALFYALYTGADPLATAWYLSWGVLAAGVLQLAVVYAGVLAAGMSIGFRFPKMTPNVKRLLILAVPAAVTGGITQINQLIGQAIASSRDGAIAALQYADRIYQLPLGVVGVAVGVVLLPELARALKGGNLREAGNLQNRSIEFVLFLTIPAAFALWILSDEIIRVLYERGAFHQENTAVVGSILAIYGIGLPAFVLIKALQPGFYAREDTKTPMRFSAIAVATNCATALTLFPYMGAPGIAVAEATAGWISTVLLFATLLRRGHLTWEWALAKRTALLIVAAAVMGAAIVFLKQYWAPSLASGAPLLTKIGTLGLLIAIAMLIYFAAAFLVGGANLSMIRRNLNRKPAPAKDG